MIGYVTVGTKDPKKAAAFMTRSLTNSAPCASWTTTVSSWGKPGGTAGLCLALPFGGKPMTLGNGVMAAFLAKDKAQVDRVYKLALSLGGTCEGPPGPRGSSGFYAAYFRDPEGNKLNAYVMG